MWRHFFNGWKKRRRYSSRRHRSPLSSEVLGAQAPSRAKAAAIVIGWTGRAPKARSILEAAGHRLKARAPEGR